MTCPIFLVLKRLLEDEDMENNVEDKLKKLKELRESHFTYKRVMDQIAKFHDRYKVPIGLRWS